MALMQTLLLNPDATIVTCPESSELLHPVDYGALLYYRKVARRTSESTMARYFIRPRWRTMGQVSALRGFVNK